MNDLIEKDIEKATELSTIVINSSEDIGRAKVVILGIKGLIERVKESFDPIVERAHSAHKEAIAQRDKHLKPLNDSKKKIESAITTYSLKMEAEQRERERLANIELAKIAEANKQKLLDQAKESSEWDAEVLKEQAQAIKPITVDTMKKVVEEKGVVIKKTWKAKVIDTALIPREYLIVDESLLNKVAKDEVIRKNGVAGVEFYEEASSHVRG